MLAASPFSSDGLPALPALPGLGFGVTWWARSDLLGLLLW